MPVFKIWSFYPLPYVSSWHNALGQLQLQLDSYLGMATGLCGVPFKFGHNKFIPQTIFTVFTSDKTVFVCAVTGLSGKEVGQSLHTSNYWCQRWCSDFSSVQRHGNLCTRCISKSSIWQTVHMACDEAQHFTTAQRVSEKRGYRNPGHLWLWNIWEKQVMNRNCKFPSRS